MHQLAQRALQHHVQQPPLTDDYRHIDRDTRSPEISAWTKTDTAQACDRPLIAIVEDDRATVEMLGDVLAMSGYRTLPINRGELAYSAIRSAQPQLVLLDLWLEHQDAGSMAVGLLSIDPATAHIPIVLCSAQVATFRARNDQIFQKAAGVIEKPFAIEELLTTIRSALDALDSTTLSAGEAH